MKRNTLNLLIDAATALVVFGLIATGLLTRFVLPPGSGSRRLLWGLGRHDWGDIHFWIAFAGGLLLLVHVTLHWQWVCVTVLRLCRLSNTSEQTRQRPWRRNVAGIALVLGIVAVFWAFVRVARLGVQDIGAAAGPREDRGRAVSIPAGISADANAQSIRGSMTLAQAAAAGAMPAAALRADLGLPDTLSVNERLSQLSREHGFSMSRVREVIREYQLRSASTREAAGR